MASSRIASRYSKSLIELAIAGSKLEEVKNDMEAVSIICTDSKDLANLLKNPIVTAEAKKAILSKVFANTNDITKSFILYLVDKKREDELLLVAHSFIASYNEMKGIASATVISAIPLNETTISNMKKFVESLVGKSDITITNEVDPTIIGGIIIKHEDKLLDKSVSKELREIRKQLIYN
jgi:F-type H+-transporting ATPase subunit delta